MYKDYNILPLFTVSAGLKLLNNLHNTLDNYAWLLYYRRICTRIPTLAVVKINLMRLIERMAGSLVVHYFNPVGTPPLPAVHGDGGR